MSNKFQKDINSQYFYFCFTNRKRTDIITKLERFLDLREVRDPDPSYALNIDNFIKILAIQMRFRFEIIILISGLVLFL